MELIKQPRFWLLVWGGLGAALLLYVIMAASVQPRGGDAISALNHDRALLRGEMSDFVYAIPARGAPEITFQFEGESIALADFRGKAILVNFWATWCLPCLKELPSLDALEKDLGGENFQVVAIASDPRGSEAAQAYLDRLEIKNLKFYSDPNLRLVSAIGGDNVLPVSILYDARGREVGRLVGEADWASPEAIRLVGSARR